MQATLPVLLTMGLLFLVLWMATVQEKHVRRCELSAKFNWMEVVV
jgi:hypothetical protein